MMGNKSFVFRFADIEVREREFTLIKAGEALPVEPKAFRVLLILLRNPQKLITKEELLNAVWGDAAVTENSLTRSVALLRRLLGDEARDPRYIETVATVGYRWICKVEVSEEASGEAEPSPQPPPDPPRPRKRLPRWVIPSAAVLVAGLALAIWYATRPLPRPSISKYVQITHDGLSKEVGGTDGNRLYLDNSGQVSDAIQEVKVSSGETTQIPVKLPHPWIMDLSPDGSTLLLQSIESKAGVPIWSLPVLGGTPRRVGDAEAVGAALSPDGKSLVYSTAAGDIFVAASDGSEARRVAVLATNPDWHMDVPVPAFQAPWFFSWSPDSRTIRFIFPHRGKASFWEMSPTGLDLHPIHTGWHSESYLYCGRWTPDGRFFVFGTNHQLWAFDEGVRFLRKPPVEPTQLTAGPLLWYCPAVSKDGRKIFAVGATLLGELVHLNWQTKQFEPFLSGISAEGIAFSPDGKNVAYVTYPEGILWRQRLDGSGRLQLSSPPSYPIMPQWSPDGAQILFYEGRGGGAFLVGKEGGSVRTIFPANAAYDLGNQSWSPDGRRIVFADKSRNPHGEIHIIDLASHQVSTVPDSLGVEWPRWSPDGLFIIGQTGVDRAYDHLRIFSFRTQKWSDLEVGENQFPTFSHDGRFVYFERWIDDNAVFRVRVSDGKVERVVDTKGLPMASTLGEWMGLDTTDAPVFLRDRSTNDVYALTLEVK